MHDQLLVAYQLILDNRRINAEGFSSTISSSSLKRSFLMNPGSISPFVQFCAEYRKDDNEGSNE